MLDPRVVEAHPLQRLDDLHFELVVTALGNPRQRHSLDLCGDALILDLVDFLVGVGDRVDDRHHARGQLHFHRGQRNRAFLAVGILALSFGLLGEFGEFRGGLLALGRLLAAHRFGRGLRAGLAASASSRMALP